MPSARPTTVIVPEDPNVPLATHSLHDGRTVVLHPMRATDGSRLLRFHHALSPHTTYLRFFTIHTELSADEVDHFVRVDHHDREAVVATLDGELVAVGRFDRLGESHRAEVAFLVADDLQGHGIGRALFDALIDRARAEDITTFVADVLPANTRMLRLFRDSGLPQERHFEEGVVRVEMVLPRGDGS